MSVARRNSKLGFSLIEAAIVLGIIGLVLGGLWVAAASVQNKMKISALTSGLVQMQNSVRSLYKSQSMQGTTMATLIGAGLLPADFLQNGIAVTPWGHALSVYDSAVGSITMTMQVETTSECMAVAQALRSAGIDGGVYDSYTDGFGMKIGYGAPQADVTYYCTYDIFYSNMVGFQLTNS